MINARDQSGVALPSTVVKGVFSPDSWEESSPVTHEMTCHENYSFHTFELSWMFIVENV
jgi:hypothetical protein